jgi:putative Mg2+ transporter-C (MgtC) family protein
MISTSEVVIRLLVALLFCGAVGVQRCLAGKAAGVRTHVLVGMGAAIFTLISGYAFHTTPANADRIAAQVVSGIGFIGGGAILKELSRSKD